jgi:molybdate-binding protein/DNA-binding transcriptional regulator YhcF (GntR family)
MMDETHLYRKIAESLRRQILTQKINPGDRLPSVREMSSQWGCTVGTVQRAYQELSRQGLVTMRAGQGTHVVDEVNAQGEKPLRRAALIHRAEAFLLEVLTSGHTLEEVESAVHQAMDRWRTVELEHTPTKKGLLRFSGSHDLALAWLAGLFSEIAPGFTLELRFTGSLGGLIALAEGQADLAGCHLWDAETDSYNEPFVRRLLPGRRAALVTLAQRKLGLILQEGNPLGISRLEDLPGPGVQFINRQPGSGTRVWLDAALQARGISPAQIPGYETAKATHSAVAQAVAEGAASAGLGLEGAALSYGLDFVPLTSERYELIFPEETLEKLPVEKLLDWLGRAATQAQLEKLGGYDTTETGQIRWV